jgi:hypothetical protein
MRCASSRWRCFSEYGEVTGDLYVHLPGMQRVSNVRGSESRAYSTGGLTTSKMASIIPT